MIPQGKYQEPLWFHVVSKWCRISSIHSRVPFLTVSFLVGRVPPTKIDYREKLGTFIITSLLEDLAYVPGILAAARDAGNETWN